MLSQLALDHGVFLGNQLNETGDSVEWVDAIYTLSHQLLSSSDSLCQETITHFHDIAHQVLVSGSWSQGQRWGFKLPESMLVLPQLLTIFPNATVVHQFRHPVSSSIRRTHRTSRSVNPLGKQVLQNAYAAAERDEALIYSDEPYLRNAYSWWYQVGQVVQFTRQNLPADRLLELGYETVCRQPEQAREKLTALLGSNPRHPNSLTVDPARFGTESFDSPEAIKVWDICRSLAVTLGYEESISMPVAA